MTFVHVLMLAGLAHAYEWTLLAIELIGARKAGR